jgi:excisionase family DNA binding protein
MKQTATAEEVIPAVFPATPENRYRALLILQGVDIPLRIDEPLLLTMGEAAQLIPCSRATLFRIIRAGRLRKIELYPNAFRLKRADVIALANGKVVARG